MNKFLSLLAIATGASSLACPESAPVVHIQNGTLVGRTANHVDSFLGIPYAKPPTDALRLRPPQHLGKSFGRLVLPETPAACINMNMSPVDTTGLSPAAAQVISHLSRNLTQPSSEDCLTVNIQRPAGIVESDRLPVVFWIHGSGWETGTAQMYDGTGIVAKSMSMGEPVVYVAIQYRLNAFGFLNGIELQEEGCTNLGLRDQRKALEWVAENIAAFGGDPDRVTIWGESAGAASVFDHLLINRGDHKYNGKALFQGALMNSGTIIRTLPTTATKAQKVFDDVVAAAGCTSPGRRGNRALECLRRLPIDDFVASMNSVPNYMTARSNDLAYFRRPDPSSDFYPESPEIAVQKGLFARVPVIMGNQQDKSTVFSIMQRDIINSTDTLIDYISSWLPETPREMVADLVATYPDTPEAGLPANTGSEWELYPQFKRLAAVQSDLTFIMGRREALSYMASEVPAWTYLATYMHGFPQWGTYHISDLDTQFSLKVNQFAANTMDSAYINFINHLDPNGKSGGVDAWWPKWNSQHLQMLNISSSEVNLVKDDFRQESYDFWKKNSAQLRQ